MAYVDTQFRRFVVGARPFYYWALDIGKQTSEFLESIDPTYFESMANVFFMALMIILSGDFRYGL